jgi:MFS family permease
VFVHTAAAAIALRLFTGAALACVYPPGMKLAASWVERRRGSALGILIGALTLGTAFPHALTFLAADLHWRATILAASALACTGALIVALLVSDGPYLGQSARFEPRAALQVFRDRGMRLATIGYLGHMWELYAMWTWIASWAAASFAAANQPVDSGGGSLFAATAISAGAIGCVVAGLQADRVGKARIAAASLTVSGSCAAISGFVFGAPVPLLYAFGALWGLSIVADSAQFSALVTEQSPQAHVGTALTVQTCAGFLLTLVTIRLLPLAAGVVGWRWAFLMLVPGPVVGILAMRRLARVAPESVDFAS